MKRLLLLIAFAACSLSRSTHACAQREGCVSDSALVSAASKLRNEDWTKLSFAKLRTLWPSEVVASNCEADLCDSARSLDRVIAGHCECCSTFTFKTVTDDQHHVAAQLNEVILNYTAPQKNDLVVLAKKIAAAIGLSPSDLEAIGRDNDQDFHSTETVQRGAQLSTLQIRFSRRGNVWELFLDWGRDVVVPVQ